MKRTALAFVALVASLAAGAQTSRIELPDMGSSAGTLLSPGEERQYAGEMLREMRRMGWLLEDPLIADYIESLGFRLVAHSERPTEPFDFLVVRDRSINAFAAPGGLIGVNVGLVLAAENEEELAAVLAHEVAHVTQRHLVRRFENMQRASLPVILATLGTLIAASQTSGDGAPAAIVTGMSVLQQQAINFTRQNEYEADRIGIQTLARAGFDATAMATIFQRMGRAYRGPGDTVPEYLRTHPVSASRIAEARNRAESLGHGPVEIPEAGSMHPQMHPQMPVIMAHRSPPEISHSLPDEDRDLRFRLMRERMRVLTAAVPEDALRYYRELRRADLADPRPHDYGLSLALLAANRVDQAQESIDRLLADHPGHVLFRLADAEAALRAGHQAEAENRYARLASDHPGHRAISLAYAEALNRRGNRDAGRHAQALLRPLLSERAGPGVYVSFARASELAGDEVRAGEAHAEAAFLGGRAEDALRLLESLTEREDLDYYQRARIDARITQITPIVLELRRRGLARPG